MSSAVSFCGKSFKMYAISLLVFMLFVVELGISCLNEKGNIRLVFLSFNEITPFTKEWQNLLYRSFIVPAC